MNLRSTLVRLQLAAAIAACAACSTLGLSSSLDDPSQVPAAIEQAHAASGSGNTKKAVDLMREARSVDGLDSDTRNQVDLLLERFAAQRIRELSAPGSPPGALADMLKLDLPQRLAVDAGVAAARLYLDQGRPHKAYRMLAKVETQYPRHHGKVEAGAILFEAGMKLCADPWNFMGMFATRDDGIEVLEYLVLTYPLERHCDEAYFELARLYEADGLFELARERHEELLYGHIKSPLAIASEARIPHLRLAGLESPEYDRRELLKAHEELQAWLKHHAGHELESDVRFDYADCLARLVASDLGIARFYRRVDQFFGARIHAARALDVARTAGDEKLVASATRLLASLPEVSSLPVDSAPGDEAFSTDSSLIRSVQDRAKEKTEAAPTPAPVPVPVGGTQP